MKAIPDTPFPFQHQHTLPFCTLVKVPTAHVRFGNFFRSDSNTSPAAADVPTLKELGYDTSFVNWRGFFAAPGLSDADAMEYQKLLSEMYATDAWAEVRDRNGWTEIFRPGPEFISFLEQQEEVIGDLMRELGFL